MAVLKQLLHSPFTDVLSLVELSCVTTVFSVYVPDLRQHEACPFVQPEVGRTENNCKAETCKPSESQYKDPPKYQHQPCLQIIHFILSTFLLSVTILFR